MSIVVLLLLLVVAGWAAAAMYAANYLLSAILMLVSVLLGLSFAAVYGRKPDEMRLLSATLRTVAIVYAAAAMLTEGFWAIELALGASIPLVFSLLCTISYPSEKRPGLAPKLDALTAVIVAAALFDVFREATTFVRQVVLSMLLFNTLALFTFAAVRGFQRDST